jgi:iron-sulfur cluster insertion protein
VFSGIEAISSGRARAFARRAGFAWVSVTPVRARAVPSGWTGFAATEPHPIDLGGLDPVQPHVGQDCVRLTGAWRGPMLLFVRPARALEEIDMSETTTENPAPAATTAHEADPAMAGALSLSDVAAEKVGEIRDEECIEDHYGLRVKVIGGGCSGFQYDLFFDEIGDGDTVFESRGVQLVVDQMSFMYLMGTQIDYVEGLAGAGFKFENPNTTGSCGCGSSFSV